MYKRVRFKVEGIAPLLVHNGQLADPLNEFSRALREVSRKRNKTESDLEEVARLEWYGSLYLDENRHPCIPGEVIESAIVDAAKKRKMGPAFRAGLFCEGNWPLIYDGPRDPDEMWKSGGFRDTRAVSVQRSRIMRTRPIFRNWSLEFELSYLDGMVSESDVRSAVETAGQFVGIGDYRPRYGRFEVITPG